MPEQRTSLTSVKRIILIACVSGKEKHRTKARKLYNSTLFKKSWAYAYQLKPDRIFILSALHGLLDPEKEIEPYNVTLSYIPPDKRRKDVVILNSEEKAQWGRNVLTKLKKYADLDKDEFIVLASREYIKPIASGIRNLTNPMEGLRQGERSTFLIKRITNG